MKHKTGVSHWIQFFLTITLALGWVANANAIAIQTIKLENEGWERDYDVTEPDESTFVEPPLE